MKSSPGMKLCGALAFVAGLLPAANYRLSQGQDFSVAQRVVISPDGVWAVYIQDAETDSAHELWRVPVEGGSPARVSGTLPVTANISLFVISPDSQWVVYTANEDSLDHLEIFSASLVNPAGDGIKLNAPLVADRRVEAMTFAPDSSRVVFGVGTDGTSAFQELWSAKPDGTDLDLLLEVGATEHISSGFFVTGDSQYVLLMVDWAVVGGSVLRIPLGGGLPHILSSDLPVNRFPIALAASADGLLAVYSANRDAVDRFELFIVPVAGGTPDQISANFGFAHYVDTPRFSPNGARIVYAVQQSATPVREVWSVQPDGGGNVKLNGLLVSGGNVQSFPPFRISPDSTRVVYSADQQSIGDVELYTVPIAGGANFKLNGPLDDGGDVVDFKITADSTHVAFLGDVELDGRRDLYAAPILGGPAIRLSGVPPIGFTRVDAFVLPGSGRRAFYLQFTNQPISGDTSLRIWSSPIGGGPRARVDGCDAPGELVEQSSLAASPVRDFQVFYAANQEPTGQVEVYAGDACLLCNGFEGAWRWSSPEP